MFQPRRKRQRLDLKPPKWYTPRGAPLSMPLTPRRRCTPARLNISATIMLLHMAGVCVWAGGPRSRADVAPLGHMVGGGDGGTVGCLLWARPCVRPRPSAARYVLTRFACVPILSHRNATRCTAYATGFSSIWVCSCAFRAAACSALATPPPPRSLQSRSVPRLPFPALPLVHDPCLPWTWTRMEIWTCCTPAIQTMWCVASWRLQPKPANLVPSDSPHPHPPSFACTCRDPQPARAIDVVLIVVDRRRLRSARTVWRGAA